MAALEGSRIVKTPDVLGGDPRIKGRRIGVHFIREHVEGRGLDPQTVADRYDLDLADVYWALTYYHEHPDEMAEIQARRERREEEAKEDPQIATGPEDLGNPPNRCDSRFFWTRIPSVNWQQSFHKPVMILSASSMLTNSGLELMIPISELTPAKRIESRHLR